MPVVSAARELLAPREDVWAFLAEPYHLPDWWPGIGGVTPDRRGFAPGARWRVQGDDRPRWLRRPELTGTLLVLEVRPPAVFAFQLTGDRIEATIELEGAAPDRTRAVLTVDAPWLIGLSRSFPQRALGRLHALCQTAADL